jgi:signal transduction histidine kinase
LPTIPAQPLPDRLEEMRRKLAQVPEPVALLEGIFAHSPLALQIYDVTGRSLLTNPAHRELFGAEPPPEYNVLRDEIARANGVLELIHRAFGGETISVPPVWYDPRELTQVRLTEGKRVAMEATFFPLFDHDGKVSHVAIAFKNVTAEHTERARADEQLRILQAVVSQSGDAIIVCDAEGAVQVFNDAAVRQRGMQKEPGRLFDWVTRHQLLELDGTPMPLARAPLSRALQGERLENVAYVFVRPDGERRVLASTAMPLRNADGKIVGAVLISRDETERRALDAERQRLLEQTQRTATFREQVLGIVGHDLRGPLSVISGSAAVLMNTPLDERQRRNVERISNNADRMARMIKQLLDYTRTRLGDGLPVERVPTELEPLLRRLIEEVQVTHPAREVRLVAEPPLSVLVDPDRLAQAISNLLSNALLYGDPSSAIEIRAAAAQGSLTIEIENRGEPIAPELLPLMFEPFAARSARKGSPHGLGLGLSIVKAIADAHRGTVAMRSSREHGTVVTVSLPLA